MGTTTSSLLEEVRAALGAARVRQGEAAEVAEYRQRTKAPKSERQAADADLAAAARSVEELAEKERTLIEASDGIAALLARRDELSLAVIAARDSMAEAVVSWQRAFGQYLRVEAEARKIEDQINSRRWVLGEDRLWFPSLPETFLRPALSIHNALPSYFRSIQSGHIRHEGRLLFDVLAGMERDVRQEIERAAG